MFQWTVDRTTASQYIMNDTDSFEWDNEKASANWCKHGVSFSEASNTFRDPFGIEVLDDREDYGEERFIRIGMVGNRVLTVVCTERGENIRIISAREAGRHERRNYYSQNA